MKLLIVDDNADYVDALTRALSDSYEVVSAASLDEAKAKMSGEVGLALVDIRLSDDDVTNRDGLVLLGWLREHYSAVPVVVMSAYRDFEAAAEALNLGAVYYLKKPINFRELSDVIRRHTR